MVLEATTVVAFLAIVALVSAAVLLINGGQVHSTATAGLWALSDLFIAIGVILVLQREPIDVAFLCMIIAAALAWTAIIIFNDRPLPAARLAAGGIIWAALAYAPFSHWSFGHKAAVYMTLIAVYVCLCGWELWRGRAEKLPARWPLLGLVSVHATAVGFGAVLMFPMEAMTETPRADLLPIYLSAAIFF